MGLIISGKPHKRFSRREVSKKQNNDKDIDFASQKAFQSTRGLKKAEFTLCQRWRVTLWLFQSTRGLKKAEYETFLIYSERVLPVSVDTRSQKSRMGIIEYGDFNLESFSRHEVSKKQNTLAAQLCVSPEKCFSRHEVSKKQNNCYNVFSIYFSLFQSTRGLKKAE